MELAVAIIGDPAGGGNGRVIDPPKWWKRNGWKLGKQKITWIREDLN